MDLEEALDMIEQGLGEDVRHIVEDGLPDGAEEQWRHDEILVKDLARVISRWMTRVGR